MDFLPLLHTGQDTAEEKRSGFMADRLGLTRTVWGGSPGVTVLNNPGQIPCKGPYSFDKNYISVDSTLGS